MPSKPIIYLDIDDTILSRLPEIHGAKGVQPFLEWATSKCEVRWLTSWCQNGHLGDDLPTVASYLNVPEYLLEKIFNPYSWVNQKTEAININDSRKWVWIQDELDVVDKKYLSIHNVLDRFIPCNVTTDPDALIKAWQRAKTLLESDTVDYNA